MEMMETRKIIENSLIYAICQTAIEIKKVAMNSLRAAECAVPPEQYYILHTLLQKSGVTQQELARAAVKDMPNITRLLDGLEKRGLVKRQRNRTDRRSYRIFITPKGTELTEKFHPHFHENVRLLEKKLTAEERASLAALLEKVNHILVAFRKKRLRDQEK